MVATVRKSIIARSWWPVWWPLSPVATRQPPRRTPEPTILAAVADPAASNGWGIVALSPLAYAIRQRAGRWETCREAYQERKEKAPMSIITQCPNCGHDFCRPDTFAGKLEKCPECRKVMRMPKSTTPTTSERANCQESLPPGRKKVGAVAAFGKKYQKENTMSLLCILGFHKWEGCNKRHPPRCAKCGKTRDKGHQWDGCVCTRCQKVRDEGHDLYRCGCCKCGRIDPNVSMELLISTLCDCGREDGTRLMPLCRGIGQLLASLGGFALMVKVCDTVSGRAGSARAAKSKGDGMALAPGEADCATAYTHAESIANVGDILPACLIPTFR